MSGDEAGPMRQPAITKAILKLARQLDALTTPDYVAVEPGVECQLERSYENVRATVLRRGGSVQAGWSLREQPTAFVEGAMHAVWLCPDGTLLDVTPRSDAQTHILFLPDSKSRWEGETVEPRRMMLHMQVCYCGSGLPFKICHGLGDE